MVNSEGTKNPYGSAPGNPSVTVNTTGMLAGAQPSGIFSDWTLNQCILLCNACSTWLKCWPRSASSSLIRGFTPFNPA